MGHGWATLRKIKVRSGNMKNRDQLLLKKKKVVFFYFKLEEGVKLVVN